MNSSAGYFGKVPSHADFLRHNLPRAFIDPWDDWLRQALDASRNQLDKGWLDAYLTSPVYRYALTPGICGETSWIGVLMPSVDRIGRYFPFTLCAPLQDSRSAFDLLSDYEDWYDHAESIVLSSLQDDFSITTLNGALTHLNSINSTIGDSLKSSSPGETTIADKLAIRTNLASPRVLPEQYSALVHQVLKETCYAYSVWWTRGSESIQPSLLLAQGFPPLDSFSAFYDGEWERWGWQNNLAKSPSLPPLPEVNDSQDPWDP